MIEWSRYIYLFPLGNDHSKKWEMSHGVWYEITYKFDNSFIQYLLHGSMFCFVFDSMTLFSKIKR